MRHVRRLVVPLFAFAAVLGCGGGDSVANIRPGITDVVYTFPNGKEGQFIAPGFDAVEGNMFQVVGSDIQVTALGYEYQRPAQLPSTTALFDSNGNLIISAQVVNTDPLKNGYYWHPISPITLTAGHQYYIGALHGTGVANSYYWNTETAAVPPFISDLGTYFKVSSTIGGGAWQFGGGTSTYGPGEIRHYVGNFKTQVPSALSKR